GKHHDEPDGMESHGMSFCRHGDLDRIAERSFSGAAERRASGAADSRSEGRAEAIGGRLQANVRPGLW
ncbi:MAG TPA: hypothetical protein VI542_15775, partial [Candidatus Tectomicrobia bacterium]